MVERTVPSREVPIGAGSADAVAVAECVDCGARYYPRDTLERLFDGGGGPSAVGNP